MFGFTYENKSEKPGDEAPYKKSSIYNTIEKSSEVREYDESEENPEEHLDDFDNQRQAEVGFSCVNVDSQPNQDKKSMSIGEKVVVPSIENRSIYIIFYCDSQLPGDLI